MKKIHTIGYEGKNIEEFLQLLEKSRIKQLIDVRSHPKSQKEDFSKENLKQALFQKGIRYRHLPGVGGLGEEGYQKKMKTEGWKTSFDDLKEMANNTPSVMMCLEKDPMRCHRRFIAERLEKEGWEVIHIGKGGEWKGKRLDEF